MKPRIYKRQGYWHLEYHYISQDIKGRRCFADILFARLIDAISYLTRMYKADIIERA
jgi:hypothetical protein